jgi:coenzyme PQQ precursor peptide PqqA
MMQSAGGPRSIRPRHRETVYMSWKAPKVIELALGAEINSYACAEAKK